MPMVSQDDITRYVEMNIPNFHSAKLESLTKLKLLEILTRKNPYLFRAKGLTAPRDLVKAILDAYLSSSEETLLGGFLEDFAIYVCRKTYRGDKSAVNGLDLEFIRDKTKYFVSIKSGPNWANSEQIKKLRSAFNEARKIYAQHKGGLKAECINGCCYGKQPRKNEHKGDYIKLCGQRFWELISGDTDLYLKIVEPIGHQAKERNAEFLAKYELVIDSFTNIFRRHFCDADNLIIWDKLTKASCEAP